MSDRLSRMVWEVLDMVPDDMPAPHSTTVMMPLPGMLLVKAYVERLEIEAGNRKKPIEPHRYIDTETVCKTASP